MAIAYVRLKRRLFILMIYVRNIAVLDVFKNLVRLLPIKPIVPTVRKIVTMVAAAIQDCAVCLAPTKLPPNQLTLLILTRLATTVRAVIRFKPVGLATPDIMKETAVVRKIVLPILAPDIRSGAVRLMPLAHLAQNKQPVVTAVIPCIKKPVALQDIKIVMAHVFRLLNVAAVAQADKNVKMALVLQNALMQKNVLVSLLLLVTMEFWTVVQLAE